MPRGGSRPGAGRKSRSRELMIERTRVAAASASVTPLDYLLSVLQDSQRSDKERFAAAIAAAPYVHPRLSNTTLDRKPKQSVEDLSTEELLEFVQAGRRLDDDMPPAMGSA